MVTHNPEAHTFSLNPQEVGRAVFGFSGGGVSTHAASHAFFAAYGEYNSAIVRAGVSNMLFADERAAALGIALTMEDQPDNIEGVRAALMEWKYAYPDSILAIDGIRRTPYFDVAQAEVKSVMSSIAGLGAILGVEQQP